MYAKVFKTSEGAKKAWIARLKHALTPRSVASIHEQERKDAEAYAAWAKAHPEKSFDRTPLKKHRSSSVGMEADKVALGSILF